MKNNNKGMNYLDFVPMKSPELDSEVDGEGRVVILVRNKGLFCFLTQKLLGKPKVSKIHLDEMGNFIWPLIDGERSVMDIAEFVKGEFGEKAEPLYNRLVTYMATMEAYGFIVMKKDNINARNSI